MTIGDRRPVEPSGSEMLPVRERILVIATGGTEIEGLLPHDRTANLHWAQAWKSIVCQCGDVHLPCDAASLVLVVGPRDRTIHHHPDAFVIHVVPRAMKQVPQNGAQVVYSGGAGFGPWAESVVLNLVGPQLGAIWTYRIRELKEMMIRARSWSCVSAGGEIPTIADEIADRIPTSAEELHVSLCMPDDVTIELADVFATLKAIQLAVRPDASIIVSCSWGKDLRVTVLYGTWP